MGWNRVNKTNQNILKYIYIRVFHTTSIERRSNVTLRTGYQENYQSNQGDITSSGRNIKEA